MKLVSKSRILYDKFICNLRSQKSLKSNKQSLKLIEYENKILWRFKDTIYIYI